MTRLLSALCLCFLFGCSLCPAPSGTPELPYPPAHPPAVGDILHLPTGFFVSEAQMLAAAADVQIVYVGETHDNPAAHRLEVAVMTALAARHPGNIALGMEMLTPAQQPVLDRWSAGELSEKEFLKAVRWQDSWGFDFDYYRELFLIARDRHIPIIGLNADKALVRAVGKTEFAALSVEQQAQLPEIDPDDPYQAALTASIFDGHSKGGRMVDGFKRVQLLWDETMAQNIARYLASPQGEGKRLLVIAGGNHVRNGFGIPRRVFRRLPHSYLLIGSREIEIPADKQDRLMDVEIPGFPMVPFDFLLHTAYEDLGTEKVRLGVVLEEVEGAVRIKEVMAGSNGERAGLKEGDIIRRIDGEPVAESFDLVYAVQQKRAGDSATLQVERDGATQEVAVTFLATQKPPHHPQR
jgi:uncharacterized iron-regulated protein